MATIKAKYVLKIRDEVNPKQVELKEGFGVGVISSVKATLKTRFKSDQPYTQMQVLDYADEFLKSQIECVVTEIEVIDEKSYDPEEE